MISNNDVIISKLEVYELSGGGYFVARNDRYAHLTKDEALMVVAHFMVTKQDHHWLKSKHQREQEEEARLKVFAQNRIETDLRKNKSNNSEIQ